MGNALMNAYRERVGQPKGQSGDYGGALARIDGPANQVEEQIGTEQEQIFQEGMAGDSHPDDPVTEPLQPGIERWLPEFITPGEHLGMDGLGDIICADYRGK